MKNDSKEDFAQVPTIVKPSNRVYFTRRPSALRKTKEELTQQKRARICLDEHAKVGKIIELAR